MSSSLSGKTQSDLRLADLVEEITVRFEAGEPVELSDYERCNPEYAEQLRQLIPTLGALDQFGVGSLSSSDQRAESEFAASRQLGDFQIVREIGRGGMGVVYEARQISLDRRVAIKVLPFAAILDGRQLARFKTEAQAAACLHHPNIVPVHSVGCDRGVHYYAMQFIDGQSLAAAIGALRRDPARGTSLGRRVLPTVPSSGRIQTASDSNGATETRRESSALATRSHSAVELKLNYFRGIAKLGIQAAEAIEHAHRSGIIHRDIKPGNLLLDSDDKLWVADFGLARVEKDSQLTMTGDVVGTLRYMSPEQAVSLPGTVDHRTDIYSLGVTLYELLTLHPAYQGADRHELLTRILLHDPVAPRKLNQSIPVELETIVGKAMEKDASDRYPTAQALADDLRCFLEDRTISARRATLMMRVQKWSRRHPAVVRSAFVTLTLIALAALLSTALVVREQGETERALLRAEDNFTQSEVNRRRAESAVDRFEKLLYVRGLGLAARAWQDADSAGAAALMRSSPAFEERPELREFGWNYLHGVLASRHDIVQQGSSECLSTACSRDGEYFASGDAAGEIRLWELASGRLVAILSGHRGPVHALDFHPQGAELASCSEDGTIRIWDLAQRKAVRSLESGHDGRTIFAIAYSPDGSTLASGGGDDTARIWDTVTLRQQHVLRGHTREIRDVAWSGDNASIATASNDRTVRLWDATGGRHLNTLKGHTGMVLCVTFSPAGQFVVSGGNDQSIRVWHRDSGEEAAVIHGHRDGVQTVAMIDDEQIVAGDRGGQLRIWHIRGKRVIDRFDGESLDRFVAVRLSPDGRSWAGLCSDGRLLVRDLGMNRTRVVRTGLATQYPWGGRERLAFSPDGLQLYCSGRILQRTATDNDDWQSVLELDVPAGVPGHFSPDGKVLATGWNAQIHLWNPRDGARIRRIDAADGKLTGLRFSPDAEQLASWSLSGPIVLWDWQTGRALKTIDVGDSQVIDLEYSPRGRRFATCDKQGAVHLWDASEGTQQRSDVGDGSYSSLGWLHDGDAIALSAPGMTSTLHWLDGSRQEAIGVNREVVDLDVSARHSLLLTHDRDLGMVARDLNQLEIVSGAEDILQGHTDRVWSVSLPHDGRRLISASRDGSIRSWSLAPDPWQWLTAHRHVDDKINDFAWSEAGAQLVLGQMSGCSFHDWPNGLERSEFEWFGSAGTRSDGFVSECVACGPAGEIFATGHRDGFVRIWNRSQHGPSRALAAATIDESISAVRFSPNQELLASCSRIDNVLKIWRTDTWQEVWSGAADDCDDLAFSSDSRWLAYCDGREAVLMDVDQWTELRRLRGHSITVHGLAFSADDRLLATACEDRKLRVWDCQSGELQQTFSGHPASIQRVVFSPDDRTLVSADADGNVKLWNLETEQELFTLASLGVEVNKLAFAPSGQVLLARTVDGRIHVFEGDRNR